MGANDMSPCELAQWMRSEYEAMKQLSKLLRQHIATMPDTVTDEWLRGLQAAFERLYVHLDKAYRMKSEGGYLNMVTESRPSLSPQVEELYSEQQQILELGGQILGELKKVDPRRKLLLGDVCARVGRFMDLVDEHDHREVMLTQVVCSLDLGTKD